MLWMPKILNKKVVFLSHCHWHLKSFPPTSSVVSVHHTGCLLHGIGQGSPASSGEAEQGNKCMVFNKQKLIKLWGSFLGGSRKSEQRLKQTLHFENYTLTSEGKQALGRHKCWGSLGLWLLRTGQLKFSIYFPLETEVGMFETPITHQLEPVHPGSPGPLTQHWLESLHWPVTPALPEPFVYEQLLYRVRCFPVPIAGKAQC